MFQYPITEKAANSRDLAAEKAQFEMLRSYLLEAYSKSEPIEGWNESEMKRPSRRTVERLIAFFLTDF